MSAQPQVTNASVFQKKSLGLQVVLAIVTLGIYTLYWTYSTAKQLDAGTDQSLTPIFGVIPILNLLAMWQISNAGEAITDQSKIVLFVCFLFLPPLAWIWIQSGINSAAE